MTTAREIDSNGFLLIKGCPISSFGIFDYGAGQLGLDGDPNRIVKVFRPESAVSDSQTIASFMNVPLINDHEMLSGFQKDQNASAPEDYGISGILTSNVYYDAPWMRGDLKVFARDLQADLASGKKDLSLGYSCDFELKPGVFDGQAYEAIQTNLRGNHIALVDEGRVPGARVLDGLIFDHLRFDVVKPSDKEINMKKKVNKAAMDNAVAQLKALLPSLEQFLNEEATEPAHQDDPNAGGEATGATPSGNAEAPPEEPNPTDAVGGAGETTGEGGDIATLIQNVEAVLAQLKSMVGGAAPAGDEGAGGEGMPEVQDVAEGLETGKGEPITEDAEGTGGVGQGKTSPGPAAGVHAAKDAAIKGFYADLAKKAVTYDRLSKVVGAFDHAAMDSKTINSYGIKKLGIKCAAGQESVALDAYLNGVEAAKKTTKTNIQARAADAVQSTAELDAYLKGNK